MPSRRATRQDRRPGPAAGLHSASQLETTRNDIAGGRTSARKAYAALIPEADRLLSHSPQPAEDFSVPGAYIDHAGHRKALAFLAEDAWCSYACAVAWQLTPGPRGRPYATKAIEVLDAWACTNTRTSDHDGELCMAYAGAGLVFAASLMHNCDLWDEPARSTFADWLGGVFLGVCEGITERPNNWGDWGALGCIAAHCFLNDKAGIEADTRRIRKRIDHAIDADGVMPLEVGRGAAGMWYTYFALAPLTAACQIVRNAQAVDLFDYVGPQGGGIEKALDYLLQYCRHPDRWPHCQGKDLVNPPSPETWYGTLFEAMHGIYGKTGYGQWVEKARPVMTHGHHYAWAIPTLLKPQPFPAPK